MKRIKPSGSSIWNHRTETPRRNGWYITRTQNEDISWRMWGHRCWWKQVEGGWIESFDGAGRQILYDWMPRSRKSQDIDTDKLPEVGDYFMAELQRPNNSGQT